MRCQLKVNTTIEKGTYLRVVENQIREDDQVEGLSVGGKLTEQRSYWSAPYVALLNLGGWSGGRIPLLTFTATLESSSSDRFCLAL